MMYSSVFAILCLVSATQGGQVYNNYQVIRVVPQTEKQVLQLHALAHRETSCNRLDFWTMARRTKKTVDILVEPTAKTYVVLALEMIGAPYHVMINDVNEVIQSQTRSHITTNDDDFFSEYRTLDEIQEFTSYLLDTYREYLSEVEIGTSYEGRKMTALKISSGGTSEKKQIWFEGGIHAREWISPATLMYVTNKMLESCTENEDALAFIEDYDIYVLFVTNPDGYQFTWDENRLWRKTRSPNEDSDCIGTDPNRNWSYEWGGEGASENPCSETYRGPYAESEPEVKAVANFIASLDNLQLFIDFHSYSQLVMYPWGYAEDLDPIPNVDEVDELAQTIASSLGLVNGRQYEYGNSATLLYAASGASDDYAYSIGTRFSYVIELPDTGEYGFLLPKEEIVPTGEEAYVGVLSAIQYLITYT